MEPWDRGQVSGGLPDKSQGTYLYGGGTDDCRAGGNKGEWSSMVMGGIFEWNSCRRHGRHSDDVPVAD